MIQLIPTDIGICIYLKNWLILDSKQIGYVEPYVPFFRIFL